MGSAATRPGIWIAYAAVLFVLLAGTGTTRALIRRFPERDYTELRLRVRTWWLIVPPVALALLAGKAASILLLAAASGLALNEYLTMAARRNADLRKAAFAYLAIPLQYGFAHYASYVAFAACVPVFGLVAAPILLLWGGGTAGSLRAAATLTFGLLLTVWSIGHIALLLELPDASNPAGGAVGWVVFLLFVTQLNDVAQYVCGRTFGRRRIAPTVSPKKTLEGFVGGAVVSSAIAASIAPVLTPMDATVGFVVGAALAAAGFAGDLTVSAIKRECAVKDTGNLLPGHGGILDRIDSLIVASPLYFYFVHLVHGGA